MVTIHKKASAILRDYFSHSDNDEESVKNAITCIQTAAELIKTDIKSITHSIKEYPDASELQLQAALEYMPSSLQCLLQSLFVGNDTRKRVASIGQSVVQAVCPRTLVAPL